MNRFGKIIGILLAAVLSFGLAGCTAGGEDLAVMTPATMHG